MTTAGGRKKQQTLGSFFGAPSETAPSAAAHAPLRTPGSSAQQDALKAVTGVATQFFAGLWRTRMSRPVGPPSAERKERERAVMVLSKAFGEWYCSEHKEARSDVAEGKDNKQKLTDAVHDWWNSATEAEYLRETNRWEGGGSPSVFVTAASGARSVGGTGEGDRSAAGVDTIPQEREGGLLSMKEDKTAKGIEATEQQELDTHGYDSAGAIMILVKACMHKWGKIGVKGGDHIGWRTTKEWALEVRNSPFTYSRMLSMHQLTVMLEAILTHCTPAGIEAWNQGSIRTYFTPLAQKRKGGIRA